MDSHQALHNEVQEVLTTAGFAAPQIEALKAGFPPIGVIDLHSFAYARKQLDPDGINSQHEREYSAGKVLRDAKKHEPAVMADDEAVAKFLVAHDLALKKMYSNVACIGGGPLHCTELSGDVAA
mmetsp:Transcript_6873/g.13722  ORF Transcript_6873/g.13722 Transcript_6873/m.13722 type:complete len:124 (+) Transcript_6873:60-431(+)|eukprot:CAMPEP_0119069432 /NCGR_PEP_ID=MMETSP1178-20130426/19561_1 /TAXON_ID=33656 /ORGANISM="unid sp, Strain CCMP2000" /LENGTH=123 /DNA_ID=CAMNT_0007051195 /DNA_START=60 /DNA_END=431 /DNA_ORIENTATION=-